MTQTQTTDASRQHLPPHERERLRTATGLNTPGLTPHDSYLAYDTCGPGCLDINKAPENPDEYAFRLLQQVGR
jgi:hypothetical protein